MTIDHHPQFSPSLQDAKPASLVGLSGEWWESLDALRSKLRYFLATPTPDRDLSQLLSDTLASYSSSLTVPSVQSAIAIVSGPCCSPFMRAFAWIGRWRPKTVAGLVYTVTDSTVFADSLKPNRSILSPLPTPVLRLSQSQLQSLKSLEETIAQAESQISDEFRKLQASFADANMVKAVGSGGWKMSGKPMLNLQRVLDMKLTKLQQLLREADNLRLDCLSTLFDILSPVQAAHCVLASLNVTFALKKLSLSSCVNTCR